MANRAIGLGVSFVIEFNAEASRSADLLMTFPAVGKIVGSKRPALVVTGRAAVRLSRMHRNIEFGHSISGGRIMAAVTVEAAVSLVIEVETDLLD
jgi:hypothetical protein